MTATENVIAAAVQVLWADDRYSQCLAEFEGYDPLEACYEWAEERDTEVERLGQALTDAGIDWRDPAVRQELRAGRLRDVLAGRLLDETRRA